MLRIPFIALSVLAFIELAGSAQGQAVGVRPYEMDWAGRVTDVRPPLLDFENVGDWAVTADQTVATWSTSREQQLWGAGVGKLVYRATGLPPRITLQLPQPVRLELPFDCVNVWVYGNNWAWVPDPTTPPVNLSAILQNGSGERVAIYLDNVRWREWYLVHRRLTAEQIRLLGDRPQLVGLEVTGGTNTSDRVLYFDNLAVYQEAFPPLTYQPRPRRGIELPAGQTVGTNTGPGILPFPTRPETILPDNLVSDFQNSLEEGPDDEFVWRYRGSDGELSFRYRPASGMLTDISAEWLDRGNTWQPCVEGGPYFATDVPSVMAAPEHALFVRATREGESVVVEWALAHGARKARVTYTLRMWQKSLVVDIACSGQDFAEFRVGKVVGAAAPRLVTLPYLAGAEQRPAILVAGPADAPLFQSALLDHCRSNASEFWFANQVAKDGVTQNGGARYMPKTDGARNPIFERLFITASPHFVETLPNVPNPKSPWMQVTGDRVWRAHGASDRAHDFALWTKVARHGMTQVVITDHETGWRDEGESFTMRTRAAPGKGGDAGQAEYARKIRALGFVYGIYNNYTDFAPVNEFWNEDYVTRMSDGQWHAAWPRCYNVKPSRAVELESALAPIIQDKFQLNTAYCDVHTAVRPWSYTDFDARVPGAGTFAATFYAYGEIMLHQKQTWQGPVYSEGNNHWYYCGLTDGNYGQDQAGNLATSPWLVDFDLRKLHPLCCNFGMGSPDMFFGGDLAQSQNAADSSAWLDRFLAATLAFGHTGFLVLEGGFENAVRSYYSLQQVHSRYAQQVVDSIRYGDGSGNLLETDAAVANGAYRRSQVATRYAGGLEVFVNGHPSETWSLPQITLPPNGWYVTGEGAHPLLAYSALQDGRRVDYVDSPAYVYANGRGQVTRFPKAVARGQLVARRLDADHVELFAYGADPVLGVSLDGRAATAVALDEAGQELQPAETRYSRGMVFVMPVPNAVSYRLTAVPPPDSTLTCERVAVIPGETVRIEPGEIDWQVPQDAAIGAQIWQQVGGRWIDFTVVPLATTHLTLSADRYILLLTPHVAQKQAASVQLGSARREIKLVPNQFIALKFRAEAATGEAVREVPLTITSERLQLQRSWWAKSEIKTQSIAEFPASFQAGECLRTGREVPLDGRSLAVVHWTSRACGNEQRKCLFIHPPYQGGVGYAFALSDPLALPESLATAFRCDIGKADGSDPGDGIHFTVAVVDAAGNETDVAEKTWQAHSWTPLEADLTRWAGQTIRLKLICDVGEADNSSGDWACWSALRLETREPVLVTTLHEERVE